MDSEPPDDVSIRLVDLLCVWTDIFISQCLICQFNFNFLILDESSVRDVFFQVIMSEDMTQAISYDLAAIVCYIDCPHQHEGKNLVALINVGPSYHCRSMGSPVSQWYIFNDFRSVLCMSIMVMVQSAS